MTATLHHLPPPKVRRALEELAIVGNLAVEGWRSGDHELLRDCERWHEQRQAVINGARRVSAGTLRVVARGDSKLFPIGDPAELRAALVEGADHVLAKLRRVAIIPPDHIGPPSGEVFGQAWDRHRRDWLAENAS